MADVLSSMYGGSGGDLFRDELGVGPITHVEVRHGTYIDAIQVTYGATQQPRHGGSGGMLDAFDLVSGERIIVVFGRWGRYLDQIGFVSVRPDNTLRQHGPYGGTGGEPFYIIGVVDAFFGRSGTLIDAIGAYLQPGVTIWAP